MEHVNIKNESHQHDIAKFESVLIIIHVISWTNRRALNLYMRKQREKKFKIQNLFLFSKITVR